MDGNTRLNEITELSSQLMTATEALLPFERNATLQLRAAALSVQLDAKLMLGLLSRAQEPSFELQDIAKKLQDDYATASEHMSATLTSVLSDEKLGSIARLLRTTDKKRHGNVVMLIRATWEDVEIARRKLNTMFKSYWLPGFLDIDTIKQSRDVDIGDSPEQLLELLRTFRERPFSVGSSDDSFIKAVPGIREEILPFDAYQNHMREAGIAWIRAYDKGHRSLDAIMAAQNAVTTLIWLGGVETIRRVDTLAFSQPDADFSTMGSAQVNLASSLRDSILRHQSSQFSMVFVGAESSGKSTFLNAFMGVELLPTGDGPTTSYPVRLRHNPGQTTPTMELVVKTLNDSITKLKQGKWFDRISILMEDIVKRRRGEQVRWKGKELPPGFDFERLRSQWTILGKSMLVKLGVFMAGKYQFPTIVSGAERIHQTLRDINDFVRICRNLPTGFDHFAPEEWPIVSLEFPNLRNIYSGQDLEIVDIPGIGGSDAEYQWDENIQQTLRSAKSIMAIVSLRQFWSPLWEDLPAFIARGTNVRATGVIVTGRDYAPLSEAELEGRIKEISSKFWPHRTDNAAERLILLCSTTMGTSMQAMKSFLADLNELPDWKALWTETLEPAAKRLFPGELERVYANHTLESLRNSTERIYQLSGLPQTIKVIVETIKTAQIQTLLRESEGIIIQSNYIAFDLRRMLAAVGKALGDVNTPATAELRQRSDGAMELLDSWSSRTEEFFQRVRVVITSTTKEVTDAAESRVAEAMLKAWQELKVDTAPGPLPPKTMEFQGLEEIKRYLKLYEAILKESLTRWEETETQNVLGSIRQLHEKIFSQIRGIVAGINPSMAKGWIGSVGDQEVPLSLSNLPLIPKDVPGEYRDPPIPPRHRQILNAPKKAFKELEKSILRLLLKDSDNVDERLENLQVGSKLLLTLVATLPFIIALPYWLQKPEIESYGLNFGLMQDHLLNLAKAHSIDLFRRLEESVRLRGLSESEVATNIVASCFIVPDGYSPSDALPRVTPIQLQTVVAAVANLIALDAAMGYIEVSAGELE